jgi:hypothetical protein
MDNTVHVCDAMRECRKAWRHANWHIVKHESRRWILGQIRPDRTISSQDIGSCPFCGAELDKEEDDGAPE